jgi:glycosyltransferase involved in cell wall biosynthesis
LKVQSISLVIPCFNEELTIEELYRQIFALAGTISDRKFEFIFVNDGSIDKTGLILNKISENDLRVKVLHLAQNRGHQIALTAGLDYACGDMIVTIDADLQDPPELIHEMLQRIEGGYDVVHAQRRRRNGETFFKLLSARFFYYLMKWFARISIIEECGDFRAITRPVLETVIAFRTPHRFLRGIFSQIGFNQCIITYDRNARYAGVSKYPFFKMMPPWVLHQLLLGP